MAGKTDACAGFIDAKARQSPVRIAIIAPTLGDAFDACVHGPSGLQAHNPEIRCIQKMGGTYVIWPNGSEAKLFGADNRNDVDRLRAGGNRHYAWAEELAAWRQLDECWDHMKFGLRLGDHPQAVASTTPKPRDLIKAMMVDPTVAVTRATSMDNQYIDEKVKAALYEKYGGTRLGRQELNAEILDDVPGALWQRLMLDELRVREAPDLVRTVVAIDPAVTSGEDSDETGIVVAAKGADGHGYVLADLSCRMSPDGWARRAVSAYETHGAGRIIAEVNNGGDLVERVIRTVDSRVAYKAVRASKGKRTRAEPVAALYEQKKIHHVGAFPDLEDQQCAFTPDGYDGSPDRVDALVWALTELMIEGGTTRFF